MIKKTLGGKMRELTAEQIQKNYDSLINTIQLHITGDRKEKVLKMYEDMKDRFMMAPASAKEHYHNAMYGGYVDQDLQHDYYIPQDNEWRRKNMGEIFKHNEKCEYMSVTDRAFFLLQHYNIPITKKEFIGIRLTDGMYEEANKGYYVAYKSEFQLRSTIQFILHQADMMASQIEGRLTKESIEQEETETFEKIKNIKQVLDSGDIPTTQQEKPGKISTDLFDELFGDKK